MTVLQILIFLIMLSVLVVLHEYGHFLLARRNGVRVTDFAMGFGPTLLKWTSKRSGTVYRWNVLPLGGYCQMKGEDGKSNEAEQQREFRSGKVEHDEDNFQAKTALQRLAIVVAGPIANFIVALALFFGGALLFGIPGASSTAVVYQLQPGMPAAKGGLLAGDRIVAIDGAPVTDGDALVTKIHASSGKLLQVTYERNGARRTIGLTPVKSPSPGGKIEGHLGFSPLPQTHRVGLVQAGAWGWGSFVGVITMTLGSLGALFSHPAATAGQYQGVIGIARMSAQAQQFGPYALVSLAAAISISLGIFNLLPIPALDGGRAAFILVEMLRGRPVDPEKEALVHVGGFAVLIVLMIAVSYHDIARIFAGQSAF